MGEGLRLTVVEICPHYVSSADPEGVLYAPAPCGQHYLCAEGEHNLGACGVHYACAEGDHNLGACGEHYNCAEGDHNLAACGKHYNCEGGDHTLAACGVHYNCRRSMGGNHNLAACGVHYNCDGRNHTLAACGIHYNCQGGEHDQSTCGRSTTPTTPTFKISGTIQDNNGKPVKGATSQTGDRQANGGK